LGFSQIAENAHKLIHFLFCSLFSDRHKEGVSMLRIPPTKRQTSEESLVSGSFKKVGNLIGRFRL
jgi:hypothetical protein